MANFEFDENIDIAWCPGCGNFSIRKALIEALQELNLDPTKVVLSSGIGQAAKMPHYVNTNFFNGLHGRGMPVAVAIKSANPELTVIAEGGDGDMYGEGGNHFIHAVRRNIDINILLFNNEIYGLTKGQYSPTSKLGVITKTSPFGTVEHPFRPGELVIGAQGKFFARTIDMEVKLTSDVLVEAAKHDGTSVVEALVNCVIFNDKTHGNFTDKEVRDDRVIVLRHGEKMIFGKNRDKGLVLDGQALRIKAVTIGRDGYTLDDVLVHDATNPNPGLHMMLVNMEYPELPVALGVIRNVKDTTYDDNVRDQVLDVQKKAKIHSVDELLRSGETWEVK